MNVKITEARANELEFSQAWRERYFAGAPLAIGNQVQLLLDDYIVEDSFGLKRVIGPIEEYSDNPIDCGPPLWEKDEIKSFLEKEDGLNPETDYVGWVETSFQNVIYDPEEDLYKAYYAGPFVYRENFRSRFNRSTSYIESKDGINWRKPELDLFPFAGKKKTNIVLLGGRENGNATIGSVILNQQEGNPEKRFFAIAKTTPPGESADCIAKLFSSDGKKWHFPPNPVLIRGTDDGCYNLVHDPERKCWLLYRRPPTHAMTGVSRDWTEIKNKEDRFYADFHDKRRVSVSMSKDMENWTHPRTVALPDEIDLSDIDDVKVFKYRDIFLGFIVLMNNTQNSLTRHTQLMWSRDGLRWERLPDRPEFISVRSMVPSGDRMIFYYGYSGDMNISFLAKDRFIGWQAGPNGGYLLTRQFVLEGSGLEINCRVRGKNRHTDNTCLPGADPLIKAELLQSPKDNHAASPYSGCSIDDCDDITVQDELRQVVTWKGSADLSALRGQSVYIRFYLRNTTLFSFRIVQ